VEKGFITPEKLCRSYKKTTSCYKCVFRDVHIEPRAKCVGWTGWGKSVLMANLRSYPFLKLL